MCVPSISDKMDHGQLKKNEDLFHSCVALIPFGLSAEAAWESALLPVAGRRHFWKLCKCHGFLQICRHVVYVPVYLESFK